MFKFQFLIILISLISLYKCDDSNEEKYKANIEANRYKLLAIMIAYSVIIIGATIFVFIFINRNKNSGSVNIDNGEYKSIDPEQINTEEKS